MKNLHFKRKSEEKRKFTAVRCEQPGMTLTRDCFMLSLEDANLESGDPPCQQHVAKKKKLSADLPISRGDMTSDRPISDGWLWLLQSLRSRLQAHWSSSRLDRH